MAATNPLMNLLLLNGGLTAMVVAGAFLVQRGLTKPGQIIAFLTYFTIILNAILSINKMFVMISQGGGIGAAHRRGAFAAGGAGAARRGGRASRGAHRLCRGLVFLQRAAQRSGGHHLRAAARATLGVIGATGSGKSTPDPAAAALLPRRVRRDHHRRRETWRPSTDDRLHRMFGVAFQVRRLLCRHDPRQHRPRGAVCRRRRSSARRGARRRRSSSTRCRTAMTTSCAPRRQTSPAGSASAC